MARKKDTICAKVERPRRNIVRKKQLTTSYTSKIGKCNKEKNNENVMKKRMIAIDDLLIKEMHGQITITKKSVLKYLKEIKDMRVHCTRQDLRQVNGKLLRCLEVCLTAHENSKEIIIPDRSQNNEEKNIIELPTFCSKNDEIIERGNTPVLRSDQTTPSNIDIQEIMSRDKEEFYTNTNNTTNVIESFNLNSLNDEHNTQIPRTSEITPIGHLSITASENIVKADCNINTRGNASTIQSVYIEYATSTFQNEKNCDSQSLLKDQEISEFITTDGKENKLYDYYDTSHVNNISKNRKLGDSITNSNNFENNTTFDNDNIESQSIFKAQDIPFNSEFTEKTSNTNEIKAGESFIASKNATECPTSNDIASLQLSYILEETINSSKNENKNISNNCDTNTAPLSKKPKDSKQWGKNLKQSKRKNNIDDSMSNLYISPTIGNKVSCNRNETVCNENMNCGTLTSQEIIPNSSTECTNFSIICDEMTETQNLDQMQKTNDFHWSKDINLNWLRNIQFIRTIEREEFTSVCNLTDSFWNDDSVPSELIRSFD